MKKVYQARKRQKTLPKLPPQHHEQDACVELNLVLTGVQGLFPDISKENHFFFSHIGHGGLRNKKVALIMMAMGVKKGIWDFVFMKRDGSLPVHWIEMKHGKNKTSDDQDDFGDILRANAHTTDVCYTMQEAFISLENRGYIRTARIEGNGNINEVIFSNGRRFALRVK